MEKIRITREEFLKMGPNHSSRDMSNDPAVKTQIKHIFADFIVYEGKDWNDEPIYYKEKRQ